MRVRLRSFEDQCRVAEIARLGLNKRSVEYLRELLREDVPSFVKRATEDALWFRGSHER